MVFEIEPVPDDPHRLNQVVLQITTMLDMYQAELARILGIKCGDIGQLSSGKQCLQPGTEAWTRALLFVRFYRLLFTQMDGVGVAMRHWLRIGNRQLEGVPNLLIVDDGRLLDVVACLERDTG
jgi:hypothetical protein